jgi:hypothetical protein
MPAAKKPVKQPVSAVMTVLHVSKEEASTEL